MKERGDTQVTDAYDEFKFKTYSMIKLIGLVGYLHHQGNGEIVDILRCAGKVNKLSHL